MDMDWNLKTLGHFFQDLMLCLQIKNQKYYGLCSLVKFVGYLLQKSTVEFFVFPAFSRKLTARWESQGKYPLIFFSTEVSKIWMKKFMNIITTLPTLLFYHGCRHRWAVFVSWWGMGLDGSDCCGVLKCFACSDKSIFGLFCCQF